MVVERIKLYEDREDVTLTTYVLDDSMEMMKGKKRPAVLVCPGGGYMSCSDREGEPVALSFASMGYHAFVLRYSTYGEGKNEFPDLSKPLEKKPHVAYPAQIRELGMAMLLIKEHADQWLVDADKIAICGFSAGAHNCSLYGACWHTPLLSEHFNEDKEKFRPAAVILGYTLSDYVFLKNAKKNPLDDAFFKASASVYLGTEEPTDQMLEEVSPVHRVTGHMPPTFLWATAEDTLVPVQHTIRLAHALADAKVPFEMHVFENGPHGLALSNQASAESKSQIYPDAAKWMELAASWLIKRFALSLPEKSGFEEMFQK